MPWILAALLLISGTLDVRPATPFVRGDANTDGKADISDAVTILSYLFLGGAVSAPLDALDADDPGRVPEVPVDLERRTRIEETVHNPSASNQIPDQLVGTASGLAEGAPSGQGRSGSGLSS